MSLHHAVARITGPVVRTVSSHRANTGIVGELCGFDDRHRIIRLEGSGQMIGSVRVGAEELQLPRLFADSDFDSMIDEPVPLVVRHIVSVVKGWIDEPTPDRSTTGSGCVDLVSVHLRWSVSILAVNVACIDDDFAGQLGTITDKPLSHIPLMAIWIKGLAERARCAPWGYNLAAIQTSVSVVVGVGSCHGAGF